MKALIIEDEPLAVDNLIFYLKGYPIEIIGAAYKIKEAVKLIKKEKPDVIFLDINLSGENGFDLLDEIDINFKIIFVTAYDEYAVRAFEVNALDYILKPLKEERIAKAVERLLCKTHAEMSEQKYSIDDIIFLPTGTRACFLKLKEIRYIEANSCYSNIVISRQVSKCSTKTLKKWGELLPTHDFVRVHRSYIVNINHIDKVIKKANGNYVILLKDISDSIEISRRCASDLRNKLSL
ncbi:MAG: LytTR family DNA-binding domain-containing protein [Ignavibacteriaceae bacterium]